MKSKDLSATQGINKKIRAQVDVLTLSATPIPRTLYFAMVGARSLSTIETAPVNRRPIRTEVSKNSPKY